MSDRVAVIVSPFFPPSTLAGVHRARHLAKHLPAAGWQPIVLCVDEAGHEERLDPALAALFRASRSSKLARTLPRFSYFLLGHFAKGGGYQRSRSGTEALP
jgi:hypothetical protein